MGGNEDWVPARLIPVTGIGSDTEAEGRATSAVLAVISMVRDLSIALFSPLGASRAAKATVETFTEPTFALDGQTCRPDGIVRIVYGRNEWTALVEVKTGPTELDADQINRYWDVARLNDYDAVVTISNELAPADGQHPTPGLKVRSNSPVQVHHISWTMLLTTAITIKDHIGIDDPEQAWLVGELVRYLEHPKSGALEFDDMGPIWTDVRDAARLGGLRKNDAGVEELATKWDQLMRFASLTLGSKIGEDAHVVLSRAHQDPATRAKAVADSLCDRSVAEGRIRVPHTAGDIEVTCDFKAQLLTASMTVDAPSGLGTRRRNSWLVGQLDEAPDEVAVEVFAKNARTPHGATLGEARADRDALLDEGRREAHRFRLVLKADMGHNRKNGGRAAGFIESVTDLVEDFYMDVVQAITPWEPSPARLEKEAAPSTPVSGPPSWAPPQPGTEIAQPPSAE